MHFTTFIASAMALAMSVSALPATPENTRYVQLRLYGSPNCTIPSLGELGVYGDMVNQCNTLASDDLSSASVAVEFALDGCTTHFYSDDACQEGLQTVASGCATGDASYGSYEVICSHL